jgi:large subunit ribosomal protein L19
MKAIQELENEYTKKKLPDISAGDTVHIHQKIKEKDKTRTQIFEGLVISRHGGRGVSATLTVRKIAADGIGVERTFPLHSPVISKIEIMKKGKVKRAKLFYIRRKQLKSLKLKERKEYQGIKTWEENKKIDEVVIKTEESKDKKAEDKNNDKAHAEVEDKKELILEEKEDSKEKEDNKKRAEKAKA